MTTLTDWLTTAKARADTATDGPWATWYHDAIVYPQVHTTAGKLLSVVDDEHIDADAAFIAAARTEHPAMVDALLAVLALANDIDPERHECDEDDVSCSACWADEIRRVIATALGVTA